MEQKVKVSFYIKKNEVNAEGKCPVMVRLTVGESEPTPSRAQSSLLELPRREGGRQAQQSQSVFSAKMVVPADLWSAGRAAGKSRMANEINRQLDEIRASALSHCRELSAVRDNVTAEEVKNILLGMAFGQETLLAYFRAFNENFDKRIGVNRKAESAKSYWYALGRLTKFVKAQYNLSDIPFTALDRSFIEKYDIHLRVEHGIAPGTIILLTVRLGTIINHAIAEGIITTNPFAGYEPERPERQPKYLTQKELNKIMTTPLTAPKHYLIRDLFLFSCFTGIPYCDMCKLTDGDVSIAEDGEVWIKTSREKTGIDYQIPLLELPLQILEQYRGTASKGRLLPIYNREEINRQLKKIAHTCGISHRLTFHVARHSFSTYALSQGVPIETVSRMLGHNNIETTQIYAKITDDKIDEDMKRLENRINSRFQFAV
jgi:integrase